MQRALALDPCCAAAHTSLAYATAHFDWAWTRAEQQFERAVTLDPAYAHAHHWRAHLLVTQRRFDEALQASQRALALQPLDVIINVHLAWHHWLARDADAAEQHRYAYEAAVIHAGLGETDRAFERLRDALSARSGWMPYLSVDPRLDSLRGDPRFERLERILGLDVRCGSGG